MEKMNNFYKNKKVFVTGQQDLKVRGYVVGFVLDIIFWFEPI